MKKIIFLFILILISVLAANAQQPEVLNKYKGVFVPPLFYGKEKSDIYGIRETVIKKLSGCGIPVYTEEDKIPRDVMKNPCSMLHCLVNNTISPNGRNMSVVHIRFFNCSNDTVLYFSSEANLLMTLKETRKSFMNATTKALEPLTEYHYQYSEPASQLLVNKQDTTESDSILWSPGRKLTWDDFKGPAPEHDPADALTVTSNQTFFQSFGVGNRFEIESEINCYFIKSKSWVKPAMKVDYLLNHEQRHFDLAEIGAREFREKIKNAHFTLKNFQDEIKRISNEINDKYHRLQEQYDDETDHSRISEKQIEWNKKIDQMLKDSDNNK